MTKGLLPLIERNSWLINGHIYILGDAGNAEAKMQVTGWSPWITRNEKGDGLPIGMG